MVFDVFPAILPAFSTPVRPVELFSSDWAYGIDKSISTQLSPVSDWAIELIDLAFITPYGFDIAQISESSLQNVLTADFATLIETLGARGFIAYEYGVLTDVASSIAFSSYDLATAFDLAYFIKEAFDFAEFAEIYSILNIIAYDIAIGFEVYFKSLESVDVAVLVEKLSDRTFSASDFSSALELYIKEFPSSDYAQTFDFANLIIKATDIATLYEYLPERRFILTDIASAFDKLIERYIEVIDERLGIDRIIIRFEDSCIKILYFAFNIYGFVNIYSINDFTSPFIVEAKLSPRTAKDHDARLDLYHADKLDYHPADAYGSYLHAWGAGDLSNNPFKGIFAWGFRDADTSLRNQSMSKEFESNKWYVFKIIQKPDETIYEVFDEKRTLIASSAYSEGHNTNLKIVIGACNEDLSYFVQEVYYDWLFVRKHLEPCPVISIKQEEQSQIEW